VNLRTAVCILFLLTWNLPAQELRAGAAKVDITPPPGHQLWGLASRAGPSTGTLDPLNARVLVLKSPVTSMAIVAVDLGRSFGDEQIADLKARVIAEAGVSHVIIAASHTHTGPTPLNKNYILPGSDRWETKALNSIAKAINDASRNAVPCRIAASKGAAYIGHNRQDPIAGGRFIGRNEARVRTSPMDPIVQVVRIDNNAGKTIAVLVNYAAHPVVLDSVNSSQYSADFPGAMSAWVESNFPDNPICLFIQGACGDINSVLVGQYPSTERGPGSYGVLVREMQMLGQELGREAVRVALAVRPAETPHAEVRVVEDHMTFRARWDMEKLKALQAVPTYHQWLAEGRPIGFPLQELTVMITTVLINRQVAILTMPGEPYVDHQIEFRDRLPGIDTVLAGYTNGYIGYIPTIRAAVRPGIVYGANAWPTVLEVGAGERMVNRGIVNVYRMLGKLKDHPDEPAPVVDARGVK
jgi:neutral ceramidase